MPFTREQKQREKAFNEWLESIKFVDKNGKVMPTKLYNDESDDPDGDREE